MLTLIESPAFVKLALTGEDARSQAVRKARRGPHSWLSYRDRAGIMQAQVVTASACKRALLAIGTKGGFSYHTESGSLRLGWKAGLNMLRQLRVPQVEE